MEKWKTNMGSARGVVRKCFKFVPPLRHISKKMSAGIDGTHWSVVPVQIFFNDLVSQSVASVVSHIIFSLIKFIE